MFLLNIQYIIFRRQPRKTLANDRLAPYVWARHQVANCKEVEFWVEWILTHSSLLSVSEKTLLILSYTTFLSIYHKVNLDLVFQDKTQGKTRWAETPVCRIPHIHHYLYVNLTTCSYSWVVWTLSSAACCVTGNKLLRVPSASDRLNWLIFNTFKYKTVVQHICLLYQYFTSIINQYFGVQPSFPHSYDWMKEKRKRKKSSEGKNKWHVINVSVACLDLFAAHFHLSALSEHNWSNTAEILIKAPERKSFFNRGSITLFVIHCGLWGGNTGCGRMVAEHLTRNQHTAGYTRIHARTFSVCLTHCGKSDPKLMATEGGKKRETIRCDQITYCLLFCFVFCNM